MALDQTAVAYSSLAPGARTTGLSDGPERQRLFSGDQQAERLPGLGDVIDPERKITEAVARKPRGKDHGKQRPPHLHLACQIDSIHDARKADIRKDHGDVPPANEHCRERGFSAFAFDRIELLVEQLGGEVTQLGVVLNEQNRSPFLLGFSHPHPLNIRPRHQPTCPRAPPILAASVRRRRRQIPPAVQPPRSAGTVRYRAKRRSEDASKCSDKTRPVLMLLIRQKAFGSGRGGVFAGEYRAKPAWSAGLYAEMTTVASR